ncbi:DUF1697 domain-containing protein [Phycicoccus endophyticus]|uniref:DUF1697 domain-containing protein n=1 Tax=Phycicoccus endophyticus TaxID=1690220 RepID=A0A7G9R4M3_9MICO|nr:DUF1697 domain-containing protein [Phycicoccus endophyticus]NHI18445.1 DUF1697 domain-containing protein [Phycicoccus endophyticus]QNN50548.1 DUF1697 domain-containing protein [Phycicoccus endophyticus]GGL23702.1 hypothetical protein GCM10012283_02300 [Phycicoccus endophyticus]
MPRYVAFLRAVNVGGRFVRMADLRGALEDAGFGRVETHIQSGNVHVTSRRRSPQAVAGELTEVLSRWAGFEIPAIVRTPAQLHALLEEADALGPLLPGGGARYLALADGDVPEEAAEVLAGWPRAGEAARALTGAVLAELGVDFHRSTLTNARIERITGLTTTWRGIDVVRAVDDRWGEG